MRSCEPEPWLVVQRANRALDSFATRVESGPIADHDLGMLLWLEYVLRSVAESLAAWAQTNDTKLRGELIAYGRGLVRLRRQLASLEGVPGRRSVYVFLKR